MTDDTARDLHPIIRGKQVLMDAMTDDTARAEPHKFHDEWRFQRSMSRGNPEAGKPISPDQPCFDCGIPFKDHHSPANPAGLREAAADALTFIEQCYWEDDDEKALIEELTSDLRAALAAPPPDPAGLREARLMTARETAELYGVMPERRDAWESGYDVGVASALATPAPLDERVRKAVFALTMEPPTSDYGRAYNDGINDLAARLREDAGYDKADHAAREGVPESDL